jgi:O-antigen/teichoic acid export membrane protein
MVSIELEHYFRRISAASISPIGEFGLRFGRTIVLSHLLIPEDMGAVAALVAILTTCELITDVGVDKFVLITSGDKRSQAVAAAQQITIVRGLLVAILMALLAPLFGSVFGASAYVGSVRLLAFVPLLKSFRNWRILQIQQEYRYGPEAVANVLAQVGAVAAAVAAAVLLGDERAMLVSLITEAIVYVVLSHLFVTRERVASVDPEIRRAALRFGLPLVVNGAGLAILTQFDRAVIANLFDLSTLAVYSLAYTIAVIPISPLQRVMGNISYPFLAKEKSSEGAALSVLLGSEVAGAIYAVGVGVFLDRAMFLVYGPRYAISQVFSILIACLTFLRFSRGGANVVLVSRMKTGLLTGGNMIGGVGLVAGFFLALWSNRMEGVVLGSVIGDMVSFLALVLVARRDLAIWNAFGHGAILAALVIVTVCAPLLVSVQGWTGTVVIWVVGMVAISGHAKLIYSSVSTRLIDTGASGASIPDETPGAVVYPASECYIAGPYSRKAPGRDSGLGSEELHPSARIVHL